MSIRFHEFENIIMTEALARSGEKFSFQQTIIFTEMTDHI